MKKLLLVTILIALTLTACAGVKATVPDDPYSKEAQAVVEKWIAAYDTLDAQALLSLYAEDVTWRDCGFSLECDVERSFDMQGVVPNSFRQGDIKVNTRSYFITNYGRFAVIQVMFAEGNMAPTPTTVIMEFKDGQILNETWYYIGE
jgi:hypothetical protein